MKNKYVFILCGGSCILSAAIRYIFTETLNLCQIGKAYLLDMVIAVL